MKNYALITGASSGIGLEIAKNLAGKGYNLILTARRKELLESLAKEITNKNSIHVDLISMDLSKYEAPEEIFEFCQSKNYQVDLLVNNASTFYPTPIKEISENHWEKLIGSNLKGPLFLIQGLKEKLKSSI